jgi:CBS domain-containing protein
MKAEDLMVKAEIVSPNETISKATGVLREKGLRELIVSEKGELLGMINMLWIAESGSKPDTKVNSIMFMPPTVRPGADALEVVKKMVDNSVETVPVLDGESLIGVVTTDQVLKKAGFTGRVRDIMVDAISVQSKDTINKARRVMRMNSVNRLPVLDGNELVGIISSSDIATKAVSRFGYPKREDRMGDMVGLFENPVSGIMAKNVITAKPDDSLEDVVKKMISNDVRALPVVSGLRLIGIVCRKDLIKTLYPYVSGVLVNFSGMKELSDWDSLQMKQAAHSWVKKLTYYVDLLDVLVDVKKLHGSNLFRVNLHLNRTKQMGATRVSVKGKRVPEERMISHAEGYGLVPVVNEAFEKLERILSNTKGRR